MTDRTDIDSREPFVPTAVDVPLAPVPLSVTVDASDADLAAAQWDQSVPDYAGLLDATID